MVGKAKDGRDTVPVVVKNAHETRIAAAQRATRMHFGMYFPAAVAKAALGCTFTLPRHELGQLATQAGMSCTVTVTVVGIPADNAHESQRPTMRPPSLGSGDTAQCARWKALPPLMTPPEP